MASLKSPGTSLLLLIALLIIDRNGVKCQTPTPIKLGYLGRYIAPWGPPVSLRNVGPAAFVAKNTIDADASILPDHTLVLEMGDDACSDKIPLEAFVNMTVIQGDVVGYIGPTCAGGCESLGLIASQYNVPAIGYVCANKEMSDKNLYDTFMRTSPSYSKAGVIVADVITHYGWRRVGVVAPDVLGYLEFIYDGLTAEAEAQNITIYGPITYPNGDDTQTITPAIMDQYEKAMRDVTAYSRIVVLLARSSEKPHLLKAAYNIGLLETNEYVFIVPTVSEEEYYMRVAMALTHKQSAAGPQQAIDTDLENLNFTWVFDSPDSQERAILAAAMEHSVLLAPTPYVLGAAYDTFLQAALAIGQAPPFSIPPLVIGGHMDTVDDIHYRAGAIHDAIMLYARTADLMIRSGLDYTNGRLFFIKAKTIVFEGITGEVSIDENGDRNFDYVMSEIKNGELRTLANYRSFTRELITVRNITWASGLIIPPFDTPICGFDGEFCIVKKLDPIIIVIIIAGCLVLAMIGVIIVMQYRKRKAYERELMEANWRINFAELNFSAGAAVSMMFSTMSQKGGSAKENTALYQGDRIFLKRLDMPPVEWKKRSILVEFKTRREMQHDNVLAFIGACVEAPDYALLYTWCQKGSLDDVLQNQDIQLDFMFKISIGMDIVSGLKFINKSEVGYHGNLKSYTCLVDNRWNVKLSKFGLREFTSGHYQAIDEDEDNKGYAYYRKQLWTAPEVLRNRWLTEGLQKADIYSLGIILQEVIFRTGPFGHEMETMSPEDILAEVARVQEPPFRPSTEDCPEPESTITLMTACWAESPEERPDLNTIYKDLIAINGGKKINIMDNMVNMLEKYANNLEGIVAERTKQLEDEKKKTEQLLYQMLPQAVANDLKEGKIIKAESFDCVTIFFSDIVGFTKLSAASTPFQVVDLLNDLYTTFDSIIDLFDVYKVETIGDAYMVVSGLPLRNGDKHAGEIAGMSLELLSSVLDFKIRHLPGERLYLRVGMHSGPVVAGVVGLKMPRYCLFGDTVNTASRMESNGLALHIHMSSQATEILERLGGFHIVERGLVEMKGKGHQLTYWLKSRDGYTKKLPTEDDFIK